MSKLLIIGSSGHGKVVAEIAEKMKIWNTISFLDDDISITNTLGYDVIDNVISYSKYLDEYDFFVGIGDNSLRQKILDELITKGASLVTLVHPSAVVGGDVSLGIGTVIMAGVVINTSTKIGKGCIINTSSSIDHDNIIEDYVHISPGAHLAGNVKIGCKTWLGIGSIVSNNVSIVSDVQLGAGTVVTKDLLDKGIYVGCPARRINS